MEIRHKLTYKLEVTARDLNLIRRALEQMENKDASELARKMTEQIRSTSEMFKQHIEAVLNVEVKFENK